jgi:hypothetical protein
MKGRTRNSESVEDRFSRALLEAVDEGLLILGSSVRDMVYYRLEKRCRLRREEIPERLEDFHRALEGLFSAGAKVIEKLVATRLYARLGLNFVEHEEWTVVGYANDAKKAERYAPDSAIGPGTQR